MTLQSTYFLLVFLQSAFNRTERMVFLKNKWNYFMLLFRTLTCVPPWPLRQHLNPESINLSQHFLLPSHQSFSVSYFVLCVWLWSVKQLQVYTHICLSECLLSLLLVYSWRSSSGVLLMPPLSPPTLLPPYCTCLYFIKISFVPSVMCSQLLAHTFGFPSSHVTFEDKNHALVFSISSMNVTKLSLQPLFPSSSCTY